MDDIITYKLEKFEGPLDLLLNLIHKNKVQIEDIPISLICDQYVEYIAAAQEMDMDLAVEFLNMASELMLIKSKMLLPREAPEEEDPRARLAKAIARLAAAKKAAVTLGERYKTYSGRMAKDTDEISVDKTYVADQDAAVLYDAMRRMLTYARSIDDVADKLVRPIVARPIIPVHLKILGIMKHFEVENARPSLGELLDDADSRPDLVAIFIGVLELVRMRRLVLIEKEDEFENLHGLDSCFAINPDYSGNLVDDFDSSDYDA
ncbi:MAG: segregation/condensation protein A [Clostridia bacterium]|nr:segregation/condensation protein A [Clostridia bacterium]